VAITSANTSCQVDRSRCDQPPRARELVRPRQRAPVRLHDAQRGPAADPRRDLPGTLAGARSSV